MHSEKKKLSTITPKNTDFFFLLSQDKKLQVKQTNQKKKKKSEDISDNQKKYRGSFILTIEIFFSEKNKSVFSQPKNQSDNIK